MSNVAVEPELNGWDRFWFAPRDVRRIALVRGLLCLITAIYFVSSWSDAAFWYADGGPFSPDRVAAFLQTSGLQSAAKWIISPLFLTDALWVYRAYLVIGIALCSLVAAGRGGRWSGWALWLMLVGWANRAMILSGLTETLLSLGLFAVAIAPPAASWSAKRLPQTHWSAGFAQRLVAIQITLVIVTTFLTMMAGRVWINGWGAYALAAPTPDRTIDWTAAGSWFVSPNVHESLTHLMMFALPIGLAMAWIHRTNRAGQVVLILWCLAVALLASHWLYAAVVATMVLAIVPRAGDVEVRAVAEPGN